MDTFKFSDSFTFSHFNTTLRSSTVLATPQLDRSARRAPESIAGTSDLTYSVKQKGLPPSLLKAQQQEQARTDTEEYDSSTLYAKFIEALREFAEPSRTLELLDAFVRALNEEIDALRCGAVALRSSAERQRVLTLLARERQNWMVLRALLADRIQTELRKHEAATQMELGSEDDRSVGDASVSQRSTFGTELGENESEWRRSNALNRASEKAIWERLVADDSELREALIVLALLEAFANDQLQDAANGSDALASSFVDTTFSCLPLDRTRIGWQATLRALETQRDTAAMRSGVFSSRDLEDSRLAPSVMPKASTSVNLVRELDCDAPIRERAMLADADRDDDARLVRALFTYVRAGRLDDAAELCRRCGQPWRAATFQEGYRLFDDGNHLRSWQESRRADDEPLYLLGEADGLREGNERRHVWKTVAAKLVRDSRVSVFERALYAALIGDADGMLAACSTLHDALWALLRSFVIQRRDVDLQRKFVSLDRLVQAEAQLDDSFSQKPGNTSLRSVFDALEASANRNIRAEANDAYAGVLKAIVLDNERVLVETVHRAVAKTPNGNSQNGKALSKHSVRFFAHLLIVMRRIMASDDEDQEDQEAEQSVDDCLSEQLPDTRSVSAVAPPFSRTAFHSKCSTVLQAYIDQLIRDGQHALVAYYAKQLPTSDDSVLCYARFLDNLADRNNQQQCLQAAERDGLDVQAIARAVVQLVTTRTDSASTCVPQSVAKETSSPTASEFAVEDDWLVANLTDADRARIAAIDWLVFTPDQRAEAIRQANTLCRSFLLADKLSGAIETLARLPADSIDTAIRQFQALADVLTPLSTELDCAIREHLAVRLYLEAHSAYQNWFYIYQNKPRLQDDENLNRLRHDSQSSLTDARNLELATRLENDRRRKVLQAELNKWNESVRTRSFETVQKLYNVVLFAGGWMTDETADQDEPQPEALERRRTLDAIRRRCLPKLALCALRVLEAARRDEEILSFVEVLVGEEHGCLCNLFEQTDLRSVGEFARRASTRLICEHELDAFGFSPTYNAPQWNMKCTQFV